MPYPSSIGFGGGSGGSDPIFTTLSLGQVPKADAVGQLIYGGATVDPTTEEWTFDKAINVPSGTLNISDTLSISEATLALFIRDNVLEQNFVGIQASIDETGSALPVLQEAPSAITIVSQPDDGTVITTNPLTVPTLASFDNETDTFLLRANSSMSNVRLTLTDTSSGVVLKYLPNKASVQSGTGGFEFVAGDNTINLNSNDADSAGVFNVGFTPLRSRAGEVGSILIEADNMDLLGNVSEIPYVSNDIHPLFTTTVPRKFDTTNVEDAYLRMNNAYTTVSGQSVGIVANYLPTSTATTVTAGQFTAGVATTSNPTVVTVGSGTFVQGDLVQISNSVLNSGIFEVEDHTGTLLTVRGVGTVATVEGFTKTDFIATVSDATITKINVSVIQSGANGNWEVAKGSVTGLVFVELDGQTAFTAGSVPFADGLGDLTEDNANFNYDDVENRLNVANAIIAGDLVVEGTITSIDTENLRIADGYVDLNAGYTVTTPREGGLVVNYLPTATNDTVTAGVFTAGVDGVSNPTVTTDGAATFTAEQIIQISGTDANENDGFYEVLTHAANVLTIRGVGTSSTIEQFSRNQFVANASDNATITHINVSVIDAGTDGDWETGSGSSTGIVHEKLVKTPDDFTTDFLVKGNGDNSLSVATTNGVAGAKFDAANDTLTLRTPSGSSGGYSIENSGGIERMSWIYSDATNNVTTVFSGTINSYVATSGTLEFHSNLEDLTFTAASTDINIEAMVGDVNIVSGQTIDLNGDALIRNALPISYDDGSQADAAALQGSRYWDTNSIQERTSFDATTQVTVPRALWMSHDGLNMYIGDNTTQTAYQYTLTTPWDVDTATYSGNSLNTAINFTEFFLRPDGTVAYFMTFSGNFREYPLSTPFDLSTAGALVTTNTTASSVTAFNMAPNGLSGFFLDSSGLITKWTLTTPWLLSTLTDTGTSFNIGTGSSSGFVLSHDLRSIMAVNNTDDILLFRFANPGDVTSIYADGSINIGDSDSRQEVCVSADSLKVYTMAGNNDLVKEFTMGFRAAGGVSINMADDESRRISFNTESVTPSAFIEWDNSTEILTINAKSDGLGNSEIDLIAPSILAQVDNNNMVIEQINGSDSVPLLRLINSGTNGANTAILTGDRDPTSTVSASISDLYIREDGLNSALYQRLSATQPGADGWFRFLTTNDGTGAGNVTTSSTLTNNFIARGNGAEDLDICSPDDVAGVYVNDNADTLTVQASENSIAAFRIADHLGADAVAFLYNDAADSSTVVFTSQTDFLTTSGFFRFQSNLSTLEFLASGDITFDAFNGAKSVFTGTYTDDTAPLLEFDNSTATNGAAVRTLVGDRSPRGNINGQEGDIYRRKDGVNSAEYLFVGTSGNIDWIDLTNAAILSFGASSIGTTTTLRYLPPGGMNTQAPTTLIEWIAPRDGFIRNLQIFQGIPGNGFNITYAVWINETIATALSVTMTAFDTVASDNTGFLPISAGQKVSLQVTKSNPASVSPTQVQATMEFV